MRATREPVDHRVHRRSGRGPALAAGLALAVLAGWSAAFHRGGGIAAAGGAGPWQTLEPGLELGVFTAPQPAEIGDSRIRALRIDPARFRFHLLNASAAAQGRPRTARDWCEAEGMVAAINASMYQGDHRTSVSLMRTGDHVNNPRLSRDRAVLAFDPDRPGLPPFAILDRECDDFATLRTAYRTLVQSIRMISCRGGNVWARQPRRWSTAAIAVDGEGRALFLHARSPYATHDLIEHLRQLPLGIDRAMYVEGGPEAQLYVRAGGEALELVGSYETGFNENDDNTAAWPVPNVVAISRRGEETPPPGAPPPPAPPPPPPAAPP
jgi:hypothetical protein